MGEAVLVGAVPVELVAEAEALDEVGVKYAGERPSVSYGDVEELFGRSRGGKSDIPTMVKEAV